ncbi:hypothetical protein CC86DRAFT_373024 [Ophiobolus disseminans]|uniref:Uncharacterized protein n=1 Tax=Ophiobolus disseminans TaxID=1469910 RepID=A0A6A6ZN46_9PLEO|nr:hypothetical protein CC86DRAFT_373024 [Ophiobolus disseminans]
MNLKPDASKALFALHLVLSIPTVLPSNLPSGVHPVPPVPIGCPQASLTPEEMGASFRRR